MVDALEFADFYWDYLDFSSAENDNRSTRIMDRKTLKGMLTYATLDLCGLDPVSGMQDLTEAEDTGNPNILTA